MEKEMKLSLQNEGVWLDDSSLAARMAHIDSLYHFPFSQIPPK